MSSLLYLSNYETFYLLKTRNMTNILKLLIVLFLFPFAVHAQFFIQSGGSVTLQTGALLTIQDGDLINNGTFNQTGGTVRFTGSTNNSISGSALTKIHVLEMAKTGAAQLQLQRTLNIGSQISFTSGIINLNNNNIELDPTALLNGESETSRITGTSGGFVQIVTTLNAPAAVNPGNLGAVISSGVNMGSTTIRRGHVVQTNVIAGKPSINRYFDITPTTNAGLNATLRFNYFDAELNGRTEAWLGLWRSNDNINWTGVGFGTRDGAANFVQQTGIASFSRWTLSDNDFPTGVFDVFADGTTGIKLWPNPTANDLNVSVRVKKNTDATLWMVDMVGRVLVNYTVKLIAGTNQLQVNADNLPAGAYTLIITAEDGSKMQAKLIKQ
jgi:Secretion system C-terminal sorting domain